MYEPPFEQIAASNFMPFIPVQEEIGNAEKVYELSDPARSIVRVFTASQAYKLLTPDERHDEIERCIAYSREITDDMTRLKNQYDIKTPGIAFAIGAPSDMPGAVTLYANVERVHGESLPTALDNHAVPDEIYDHYLVSQARYAMDCIKTGSPCRFDIIGREVQYVYGHVSPHAASDEIYLVDVGDMAKEMPAAELILKSGRRSRDGVRKPPYSPLRSVINNAVYATAKQLDKRESEGYQLPVASEVIAQARTDLLQLWPNLVQPLEDRYNSSQQSDPRFHYPVR
ncbi:MAG: hypothetical protein ACQR33_06730 [Candidatus Saccharibacteria bacterium]